MDHLNETTIELYLLEAKEVGSQRREIELHLHECEGCRELYDSIAQFYEGIKGDLTSQDILPAISLNRFPEPQNRRVSKRHDDRPAVSHPVETALPIRVARWVAHHPYVAGGGTLLALGMLVGLLVSNFRASKESLRDMNAVSVKYAGEVFLLQNKYAETIGELHVGEATVQSARAAERYGYPYVGFADIDSDGKNEVIWARNPEREIDSSAVVFCQRVGQKQPLWATRIQHELRFDPAEGPLKGRFRVRRVQVGDYDGDGTSEVYVVAFHDNSPSLLVKLEGKSGRKQGTYAHAGHINTLSAFDFDGDGSKELLLAGANNGFHSAFISVLDPRSISGHSLAAAGRSPQGMQPANERAYILLPMTQVGKRFHPDEYGQARIERMSLTDTSFIVIVDDRIPDPVGDQSSIMYLTFDKNLRCISAVPSDRYTFVYGQLVKGGSIPNQPLEKYLEEYIQTLLYWDGERWVNAPTWNKKYHNAVGNARPPS